MRIAVFTDGRHSGVVRSPAELQRYLHAPNARYDGRERIDVVSHSMSQSEERGQGSGSAHPTYQESMASGPPLTMLKRHNGLGLVRWGEKDVFAAGRWNPDKVPRSLVTALS